MKMPIESIAEARRSPVEEEIRFQMVQHSREHTYGLTVGHVYTIIIQEQLEEKKTIDKKIRVMIRGLFKYHILLEKQSGIRFSMSYSDFKKVLVKNK